MNVELIRSSTWMSDSIIDIQDVLDETIDACVEDTDTIINIEVKERNGLSRFWIYVITS